MHTDQICETRNGEKVQEVVIADGTGHITLNIWGEHVGKVEEGHCYEFKGLMVKEFYGSKCVSTSKDNCAIDEVDDIGATSDSTQQLQVSRVTMLVSAVEKLEMYNSCMKNTMEG